MGFEKLKLKNRNGGIGHSQLVEAIAGNSLTATLTEPFILGGYLEAWFRCLKLSKEYTQNCRTGLFPSEKAYQTFCLFGSVEDHSLGEWWHRRGFEKFRLGFTSLRVRQVVQHKVQDCYAITLDVYPGTSVQLAGSEFEFWVQQVRNLNDGAGLLSNAPMLWANYKSRISYESIKLHLDVVEAHEHIIRNSPNTRLWRIGEQLHLNPKAMTRKGDSPREQVDKHVVMGQTVSEIVRKGQSLVKNACAGMFPKYAT